MGCANSAGKAVAPSPAAPTAAPPSAIDGTASERQVKPIVAADGKAAANAADGGAAAAAAAAAAPNGGGPRASKGLTVESAPKVAAPLSPNSAAAGLLVASTLTAALKPITEAELAAHDSEHSPWVAIHGLVYDISQFHAQHPGGSVILGSAGTDGTDQFEMFGHTTDARDRMKQYCIGRLTKA